MKKIALVVVAAALLASAACAPAQNETVIANAEVLADNIEAQADNLEDQAALALNGATENDAAFASDDRRLATNAAGNLADAK